MLVWTAGKSGSSNSSPFFRQLSRSRSNSELITSHSSLTELLTSSSPPLTRSHSRDPGPLCLAVRSGLVAREVAAEERVARRACWYKPPSILGQAVAAESWALPRFLVRPTQSCGNHRKACVSIHAITTCMAVLHWIRLGVARLLMVVWMAGWECWVGHWARQQALTPPNPAPTRLFPH